MDFTSLLPNFVLIAAIVVIILFIKRIVNDERKRLCLEKAPSWVWLVAAAVGGIVAALIVNLAKGFSDFNVWTFIADAFIHAAGAAFVYDTGKVVLPDKNEGGQ